MNLGQAIKMSVKSIAGNKMRSFLTMLGIIIGVASVIIMVSLVQGTTADIKSQMESMGTNMINVMLTGRNTSRQMTMKDMQKLVNENPDYFVSVSPSISGSAVVKVGTENESTSLIGTNEHYAIVTNVEMESGRFLSEQDSTERKKSAVIGKYVANTYFEGQNPLGQTMKVAGQVFTVTGVMKAKTTTITQGSQDDRIIIPYTTAQRLLQNTRISSYIFQAKNSTVSAQASDKLEELLLKVLGNENAYRVMNQAEMLETVETITATMSVMLGGIAGISLLVGGIGIMNIMLVSVTERTKEIGIRKAIGARRASIMSQFIIESVIVSCIGGIVGIILGVGGANILASALNVKVMTTVGIMLLASGVSIAIGVFFGWYPANKASKLNPIDALRFE